MPDEIRFPVTIRTTALLKAHPPIIGVASVWQRGKALASFLDHFEVSRPERWTRLETLLRGRIEILQPMGSAGECRQSFEAADAHFHPFLLALWFYTRHPEPRRLLGGLLDAKLRAFCEQQRCDLDREASNHPGHADLKLHRRYALLFAANVLNGGQIARAMRLDEDSFRDVVAIWIDDPPAMTFPELLDLAEATSVSVAL